MGGIINIEMARMGLEGYSLYVVGGGDDYGTWNVAANGMLKYGKLSLSFCLIMTWGRGGRSIITCWRT
ncbi:MAG: hypothetical protein V8R91_04045 [Butyricimonas faecihominis]